MGARPFEAGTSINYSLGATYAARGFYLALDFYEVSIDDRIVLSSTFIDPAAVSSPTPSTPARRASTSTGTTQSAPPASAR
jgi:hypothetical protein